MWPRPNSNKKFHLWYILTKKERSSFLKIIKKLEFNKNFDLRVFIGTLNADTKSFFLVKNYYKPTIWSELRTWNKKPPNVERVWEMACYSCYCGWCGWSAWVGGMLAWVAWVACLCGWCGWRANLGCMLLLLLLLLLKYYPEEKNVNFY